MTNNNSFNKISIITPTYNRANLIPRAIQSVLNQGFQDWELIVVDDASTDNTETIVKSYNDKRIRYFRYDQNKGNAFARNIGVKEAKNNLITFLDSDDEFLPTFLEKSIDNFNISHKETENLGMIWGGTISCNYNSENQLVNEKDNGTWKPTKDSFFKELKIGTGCGVLLRKDFIEKAGMFDDSLRVAVDTDFFLRYQKIYKHACYNESLIKLHHHQGNRVHKNFLERAKSYDIILNKHTEIWENQDLLNIWAFKAMLRHYKAQNTKKGNEYFKLIKPVNYKHIILKTFFNLAPKKFGVHLFSKFSKIK